MNAAQRALWLPICLSWGLSWAASAPTPVAAPTEGPAHTGAASGGEDELPELMRLFGQRRHAEAHFEQQQYLASLTRPLQSAGTLSYDAPDHLEQHVQTPRPQLLVLDHGQLTLQIGRHRRSVALSDYPDLAPLLDSIRAMLAGDLPALQQRFELLQLTRSAPHWQLRLTPRTPALRGQLLDIRMRGEQAQILEVQLEQQDGDHSVMHIEPGT